MVPGYPGKTLKEIPGVALDKLLGAVCLCELTLSKLNGTFAMFL